MHRNETKSEQRASAREQKSYLRQVPCCLVAKQKVEHGRLWNDVHLLHTFLAIHLSGSYILEVGGRRD